MIALPEKEIQQICEKYGVHELLLFGSALHESDTPESDVDFLVEYSDNDLGPWMAKHQQLRDELSRLLSRPVDLVPKDGLKWMIRDEILHEARPVYAKG